MTPTGGPASRWGLLALVLMLAGGRALAQPAPVCNLLAEADVAAAIGAVQRTQAVAGPDTCVWTAKDRLFVVTRVANQPPGAIEGMLGVPKLRAAEGDTVTDEPGVGDAAVSEIPKAGNRVTLLVASGSTIWSFSVEHVYATGDVTNALPGVRELAGKVIRAASRGPA